MGDSEVALCMNFCFVSLWASHTSPSADKGDVQSAQYLLQVLPPTLLSPFDCNVCLGLFTS